MIRKLIDMAVAAGRKRQSPLTGFVHEPLPVIPIVENALFALALLRTRTGENIEEAKNLLDRLLYFQHSDGNFPVYLHEYPNCRDRYLGLQLLLPFHLISTSFHQILGAALKSRLEEAIRKLQAIKFEAIPPFHAFKWNVIHKNETGDVEKLFQKSPAQMAELLPFLQMVHLPQVNAILQKHWNRNLLAYVGPAFCEWQEGSEPQVTFYDLYMGYLSDAFSTRTLKDNVVHLQGALLQPTEEKWTSGSEETIAVIPHSEEWPQNMARCFHRFHASWGTPELLHTLVCQGGNIVATNFENNSTMICTLGPLPPEGDREKAKELAFYLNVEAAPKILVGDIPATTFRMGEVVKICSAPPFTLTFELLDGSGDFVGHIMRGNRPAQLAAKGENRYEAYDWQIVLRTLRRSETCKIQVKIGTGDVAKA